MPYPLNLFEGQAIFNSHSDSFLIFNETPGNILKTEFKHYRGKRRARADDKFGRGRSAAGKNRGQAFIGDSCCRDRNDICSRQVLSFLALILPVMMSPARFFASYLYSAM